MRRINDALGRFYSTLVYVYLSVTLGKDRHILTAMLGKDRHIHIRIACAHIALLNGWRVETASPGELETEKAGKRERVLQNISGWLREKAFAAVCTSNH